MLVVGLDLSITATGICYADGTTSTVKSILDGDYRLITIVNAVDYAASGKPDLAVIEDLPRGAMSAGITGMVHGAVRHYLMLAGIPYALVTPATLKAFATGKGNASKPDMAVAAFKRAGVEFADDNQCDAWWLRAAGLTHLGVVVADLPAANRAALGKVTWPVIA